MRRLGTSATTSSTPKSFDLIIMDIQMRQVNGDEVCRQLVAAGFGIPIIAMTGTLQWNTAEWLGTSVGVACVVWRVRGWRLWPIFCIVVECGGATCDPPVPPVVSPVSRCLECTGVARVALLFSLLLAVFVDTWRGRVWRGVAYVDASPASER